MTQNWPVLEVGKQEMEEGTPGVNNGVNINIKTAAAPERFGIGIS